MRGRLALALLFAAAACRNDGGVKAPPDAAAVDAAALCAGLCALRDRVGCARPLPGCIAACTAGLAGACGAPWALAYACSAAHPVEDYFCDDRGQPQLKDGACGETFAAVQRCVAAAR